MSVRIAALWSIASQYVSFVLLFASSVIVSRFFLLPEEVGLYSIAIAAAMIISLFQDFGLTRYLINQREIDPAHLRVASSIAMLFALLIAAGIAFAAAPLAAFYGEPGLWPILLVIALSYLITPFATIPQALCSREMKFKDLFWINLAGGLVNSLSAITFAWAGWSAMSLALALVLGAVAKGIAAQAIRPALPPLPFRLKGARPILEFGAGQSTLFVISAIGARSPDLIVGRILGLTAVGLFSRATSLADQFRHLMGGAIGQVFYPAFRQIRDRGEALGPPYLRVCAGYSAIIWPSMAGLAVASEPLVLMLYGDNWAGVAPLLTIIALSQMVMVALPLHIDIPILMGRTRTLIALNIVDALAAIATLIIGSQIGLAEAALARVVYALLWLILYARFVHGIVRFDVGRLLAIYVRSLMATGLAVLPLLAAYRWWTSPGDMGIGPLALATLAGIALWGLALIALRHPVIDEFRDWIPAPIAPLFNRLAPRRG